MKFKQCLSILVLSFMLNACSSDLDRTYGVKLEKSAASQISKTLILVEKGQLKLNQRVIDPSALEANLRAVLAENPTQVIVISANKTLPPQELLFIVDQVKAIHNKVIVRTHD